MLDQPVQYLKGVGPKRAKLLERMGIMTARDLLGYFPREYSDRRVVAKIATLATGQQAVIMGKVEAAEVLSLSPYLKLFKAAVADGTGIAFASFFRKVNPYHNHDLFSALKRDFAPGNYVYVYGQADVSFGEKQVKAEEYEVFSPGSADTDIVHFGKLIPVYPLTEGIGQKWLREFMRKNLEPLSKEWPEIMPKDAAPDGGLPPARDALRAVHFPPDPEAAENARKRLALDEFLLLETALTLARKTAGRKKKPARYEIRRTLLTPFREKLGFEFTPAQKKVINEIFSDLQNPHPMNRLLLGDVGSGKTVVALSALLLAVENGFQAALLAPTEILAEQHYLTLQQRLAGLGVKTALLTGKLAGKQKEKQGLKKDIADGAVDIVVGTHALLEKDVRFKNLALIGIDEQHRFGVLQRAALQSKARTPDVLVMTATPIPRTLALTLYGDLDVSVIDGLPPGRQPVCTLHRSPGEAYGLVKQEIRKGRQAFIVYPLVEESDKIELKAAVKESKELSENVFREFRVGLLHGQMKAQEKDAAMRDFRDGKFDILIATTVIEVGIDVPNASVMVIEHADRFGLATLHQLRGRIGRGSERSFCVLLGTPKSDDARQRIGVMLSTTDGFRIAEEDLKLRGPGEFFGTAQHGMPPLRAGDIVRDVKLIETARSLAADIVAADPGLVKTGHGALKAELTRSYRGRLGLSKIG